jgi:hypothetical protein
LKGDDMDCNSVIIANEAIESNIVDIIPSFVAAIIGGVVAGGFTLVGVILAHKKDVERQKNNKNEILRGLYQALYTEIETLWKAYQSNLGRDLEELKAGEYLDCYYPFTSEQFPVYKANLILQRHLGFQNATTYSS